MILHAAGGTPPLGIDVMAFLVDVRKADCACLSVQAVGPVRLVRAKEHACTILHTRQPCSQTLPPHGGTWNFAATWRQCPTAVSWLLPLSLPVVIGVPKGRHHRLGVVAAVRLQESKAVKGASLHLQCGRCVAILRHTTMGKCRHMAAMMLCRHMAHGGILTWRHLILPPPCGGMCVVMAATMGRQRTAVTLAHCLKSSTAPRQVGHSHASLASGVGCRRPSPSANPSQTA